MVFRSRQSRWRATIERSKADTRARRRESTPSPSTIDRLPPSSPLSTPHFCTRLWQNASTRGKNLGPCAFLFGEGALTAPPLSVEQPASQGEGIQRWWIIRPRWRGCSNGAKADTGSGQGFVDELWRWGRNAADRLEEGRESFSSWNFSEYYFHRGVFIPMELLDRIRGIFFEGWISNNCDLIFNSRGKVGLLESCFSSFLISITITWRLLWFDFENFCTKRLW